MDRAKEQNASIRELEEERKRLQEILDEEFEEESVKKPITTTVTYGKDEMDKHLNYTKGIDLLDSFGLKLPSNYKDKSMEEFQKAFEKEMEAAANLKRKIKNVAYYKKDTDVGILRAYADKGDSAHSTSQKKY